MFAGGVAKTSADLIGQSVDVGIIIGRHVFGTLMLTRTDGGIVSNALGQLVRLAIILCPNKIAMDDQQFPLGHLPDERSLRQPYDQRSHHVMQVGLCCCSFSVEKPFLACVGWERHKTC